jgi:hypothetical protein
MWACVPVLLSSAFWMTGTTAVSSPSPVLQVCTYEVGVSRLQEEEEASCSAVGLDDRRDESSHSRDGLGNAQTSPAGAFRREM